MSEVLCELKSGVFSIAINRPESRNALTPETLKLLRSAIKEAQHTRDARIVTLTGSGEKVFCAGADLKASQRARRGDDYRQLLLEIRNCNKVTVAIARGHVLAGGVGLLLACDLAVACDDIYFTTPEINVGMFPMMVLALLTRHLGPKRCAELVFLGEKISAQRAFEYGLFSHIFHRAEAERQIADLIVKLSKKSGKILGLGKKAMIEIESMDLERSLSFLDRSLTQVMETEDSKEGRKAFAEKREPQWRDT